MTIRSAALQVELATVPDVAYVAARTAFALPPSDADPIWDEMRVIIDGNQINRAFDPGEPIVTGALIAYVTMSDEPLVTMAGEPYVTMVLT